MPKLLPLSKAARLIGIKRTELQKKIQNGELSTFEGMITLTDLLRLYPETKVEDTRIINRVEEIKAKAVEHRRREETTLPTSEILAIRLKTLQKEFTSIKSELNRCSQLIETLLQKFNDIEKTHDTHLRLGVVALHDWLKIKWKNFKNDH